MNHPELYNYKATVTRVVDGDTVIVDFQLGLDVELKNQRLRLYGINTPELHGIDKDKAIDARNFLSALILNQDVFVSTFKSKQKDKYGRYLVKIFLPDNERSVNQILLDRGYAMPLVY